MEINRQMQNCFNLLICDLESKKPFEKGKIFIGLNTQMFSINSIKTIRFLKNNFHKPKFHV